MTITFHERAYDDMATEEEQLSNSGTNAYDLDLDTLVKPSKKVKINGEIIEIEPPELEQLLKLSKLGGEIQKQQTGKKMSEEEAVAAIGRLREAFTELVPALKDKKPLNVDQLLALLNMVVTIAMPNDVTELEKRGIKLDADQKKILSDLSNK